MARGEDTSLNEKTGQMHLSSPDLSFTSDYRVEASITMALLSLPSGTDNYTIKLTGLQVAVYEYLLDSKTN